jgi:hypothetical protein
MAMFLYEKECICTERNMIFGGNALPLPPKITHNHTKLREKTMKRTQRNLLERAA